MKQWPFRLLVGASLALPILGCARSAQPPVQSEPTPPPAAATQAPPSLASAPSSNVTFSTVDEVVSDTAIKTQIAQHLLASGVPTREQLEAELLSRYQAALARRGFRHHETPTNIFIYIYGSEEQARARQGLWIGMIGKGYSDTSPRPTIDEGRLAALSARPEERFGLSEDRRKAAFRAVVAAEDRATNDAMEQVPDSQIMRQIALERELQTKYKRAVAHDYGVTEEQLQEIGVEGIKNGWPR